MTIQKVTHELPSLVNGVSQQHPQLRLASQGDIVTNMTPSLVHGLRTRAPLLHVARLNAAFSSKTNVKTHVVPRGDATSELLLFHSGTVNRFSLAGSALPISVTSATYLSSTPETDLEIRTVADHTFVVNKKKITALHTAYSTARQNKAMIFIKVANYLTDYWVQIGNVVGGYTTPAGVGTETDPPAKISTAEIAYSLATAQTYSGYTVTAHGSIILITAPTASALKNIKCWDSRGDTQMYLITDTVKSYDELPTNAPPSFITKVLGGAGDDDDYYVQFVADTSDAISSGYWKEIPGPYQRDHIDGSTMPHAVVYSSGNCVFQCRGLWSSRYAGDDETNPPPSFIGNTINDIFFYHNRLGVLSGDNIILSQAGDVWNFWAASARTITDADPIDYSSSQEDVHKLRYAIPFQEMLLLFSEKTQFSLGGGEVLTPSTAVVKHISSHQIREGVRPTIGSKTLFLCADEENGATGSRFREFYVDSEYGTVEIADITAHVPQYVPVSIRKVVSSATKDMLFILPASGTEVYVYKYFWSGKEKLQSAWFKWTLPSGCVCKSIEAVDNELFFFNVYSGALHLEKMSLEVDELFTETTFPLCLDRQFTQASVASSYNSTTDVTSFTLPFAVTPATARIVETATSLPLPLRSDSTSSIFKVDGNHTGKALTFGCPYTAIYQFSDQVTKTNTDGTGYAITTGRLQYRSWNLTHGFSGRFAVHVTNRTPGENSVSREAIYSSTIIGTTKNGLGSNVLKEGTVRVGVNQNAENIKIRVETDDHLPLSLISASWEGRYATRAGRLV